MNENVQNLANAVIPEEYKAAKFFSVMMFYRNGELGIPREVADPNEWNNTRCVDTEDGQLALNVYANTPCPASQLIEAQSREELEAKKKQMIDNFKNKEWLDKNLYPYL